MLRAQCAPVHFKREIDQHYNNFQLSSKTTTFYRLSQEVRPEDFTLFKKSMYVSVYACVCNNNKLIKIFLAGHRCSTTELWRLNQLNFLGRGKTQIAGKPLSDVCMYACSARQ